MIPLQTLFFAIIGGLFPALVWLYFWLQEDRRSPEPRGLILLTFIAGMIAVPLVLPLEQFALSYFGGSVNGTFSREVIISWATIEEIMKYLVVALVVLWRKEVNDPIDVMVYMVTAALGFAALENTLFLFSSISVGTLADTIITGNLRFLGSSLLHVLASATVGFTLAISFYTKKRTHILYASIGLILAIALHSVFNLLILSRNGIGALSAFFFVWTGILILFVLFEIAKYVRKNHFTRVLKK